MTTRPRPVHYDLTVQTDLVSDINGAVIIDLEVQSACRDLLLDAAKPLNVTSVAVLRQDGTQQSCDFRMDSDSEEGGLTIAFAEPLPVGSVRLAIKWTASFVQGALSGFYRIGEGDEAYAVTQFQPTSARRAFPCFDTPSDKATFSVTLIVPDNLQALSNTTVASESPLRDGDALAPALTGSWKVWRFNKTVPMSTYVLAWAVGKFSSVTSTCTSPLDGHSVALNVYASTTSGHIESGQARLAITTLAQAVVHCEKLFDVPYPLDKLDILVCDAFEASAMENFGLITGRATALLHDDKKDGLRGQFKVVTTICHEVSHMWFGNMVTMPTFDEIYLNEAFATLMGELLIPQHNEPTWSLNSAFIRFHRSTALSLDSLQSSHPVHSPGSDATEAAIAQTFDAISYEKGASVLYMLRALIGTDAFLKGVSVFLKTHRFACASGKDLWAAMSEAGGRDVSSFMQTWIEKTGFPVVSVEESEGGLYIKQGRFCANRSFAQEDSTLWQVPLHLKSIEGATLLQTLVGKREALVHVPDSVVKPCIINAGASGFYRVQYPQALLEAFAVDVDSKRSRIEVADRLGILQDVIVLSEAGYCKTSKMLEFLKAFKNDSEYLVWTEMAMGFKVLLEAWWEEKLITDGLKAYARSLFEPILEKLGFVNQPGDDADRRLFRMLVVSGAATTELPSAIAFVKESFAQLATGNVSPGIIDLTETIVTNAVMHGGQQEYEIAMAIYSNPPTPHHQLAAIAGLTATRDPALIQRTMGLLVSGQVADHNMVHLLIGLASNPLSKRMTWQAVKQAWPVLTQRLGASLALGRLVLVSIQLLSTRADAEDVKAFFADKDTKAYGQILSQGVETIEARAAWIERDTEDVRDWLASNGLVRA